MRVASSVIDSGGGQTVRLLFANVGSMLYIFDAPTGFQSKASRRMQRAGKMEGRQ